MNRAPDFLLFEDDLGDAGLIQEAVSQAGLVCQWNHADNGERALGLIERVAADDLQAALVIVDINLPRRDGKELLRTMRANTRFNEIPIIVATGSLNPREREEALALGANGFFNKPSSYEAYMELGGLVKNLLQRPGGTSGLA